MSDYYLSGQIGPSSKLYISPITAEIAAANDIDSLESVGYFLYQKTGSGHNAQVSILAKLPSEHAAFELGDILGLK